MQQIRLCLTSDATNLRDIIASHAQSSWHMWQPGFPIFMNLCFRNPWSQICDTCGRWVILSPHRSINTKSQYSQDFRANYADLGCKISYSGDKKRKMLRCVLLMAKCEIGRLVPVQMKLWSGTFLNIFIKWNIVGLVTNVHSWEYLLRSATQLSPVWIATPDNTPSIFRFWVGVGRLLPWSLS